MISVVSQSGERRLFLKQWEAVKTIYLDNTSDTGERNVRVTDRNGEEVDYDYGTGEYVTADGRRWKLVHD